MPLLPPWSSVVRVETTERKTYDREAGERKRAVGFKPDRTIDSDETWMFTDGSGSGWHGLVVLRQGEDSRLVARDARIPMKNVGAEMNALLLALEAIRPGERVVVVADFLWNVYYLLGWYKVNHPTLQEQVAKAHALLDACRPASLRYVHIRGHAKDSSPLGHWNHIADRLCALHRPVDCTAPVSAFGTPEAPRPLAKVLLEVTDGEIFR
ncbi:ribonuclease HI [Chondromyces apiculatus]|uniref:RNase H type-1 domain-containing protein n=1 Tax=Chondromyces apiculatus DSM 436 TaxID=1192034 RepID=A0A017T977_9BACT|nr:RNase H family protein [Chondromyces apiculatus]EYF05146.1 Hypothetical protein CAP_3511 [Chondromyces apiculatus DSM 436]